jgi:hypothetical protein
MIGISGLHSNVLDALPGGSSQNNSTPSKHVSARASTSSSAMSKSRQEAFTMLLSEVRLSMAQSLLNEEFSASSLESLNASLCDLQSIREAGVFQSSPDLSQSVFSSDSLGQILESLNPAKDLLNIMEHTSLAQRNPELIQSIRHSLEPRYTDAMSYNSPGSLLDLRA